MLKKQLFFLSLIVLFLLTSCSNYFNRRLTAFEHIEQMDGGILLVRLRSFEDKKNAFEQLGKIKKAEKLDDFIEEKNLIIVKAFKSYFDFSQIYFFYPQDSKAIKNKDFDSAALFDNNLKRLKDVSLLNNGFHIASFGNIYEDVILDENQERVIGGTSGLFGLYLMDDALIPLSKPFPTNVYIGIIDDKKTEFHINKAVHKLNAQLKDFALYTKRKRLRIRSREY